jgi:hypothetical protein
MVRQQRPIGQEEQSFRPVPPRRYLKDDTGSSLHGKQIAVLWCGFKGGVLRLTDLFDPLELDPTAGRCPVSARRVRLARP